METHLGTHNIGKLGNRSNVMETFIALRQKQTAWTCQQSRVVLEQQQQQLRAASTQLIACDQLHNTSGNCLFRGQADREVAGVHHAAT